MNKTRKLVLAAMLAVITFVVTAIIKVPAPFKGYMNLGDAVVLISSWLLPAPFAFLSAAIGSAFADLYLGYVIYSPATFIIKGLMALLSCYIFKSASGKLKSFVATLISGLVAEVLMVSGYLIYESFLYGFTPALLNSSTNIIQGVSSLAAGIAFYNVLIKRLKTNRR